MIESIARQFDVVIIGGGPAGTAAGLTLLKRDGVSVAIVEKTDHADPVIGESLSPGIRPLLEYLDVWESFSREQSLQCPGTKASWGAEEQQTLDYLFTMHGMGWGLDRAKFNRMLATEFESRGGKLFQRSACLDMDYGEDGNWKICIRLESGEETFLECRYVIDASGRKGCVTKNLGIVRTEHDHLVGVGKVGAIGVAAGDSVQLDAMLQVEACETGWWYSAPIPGNRMAVVLMTDADIVRNERLADDGNWKEWLDKTRFTAERASAALFDDAPGVFPASSAILQQSTGVGWVAVGDAVASHDPLSSSGIPNAIGSGVHGALVAASCLFSDGGLASQYQENIQRDFSAYLDTRWQYYSMEQRWPDSLFWRRRTTPVHIDPLSTIKRIKSKISRKTSISVHLPPRMSRKLMEYCVAGQSVHQAVRDFLDSHPAVPDQRAILEFQHFMESGLVELAASGNYREERNPVIAA